MTLKVGAVVVHSLHVAARMQVLVMLPSLKPSVTVKLNSSEDLPEGADMNLSCGNPTEFASLKKGQVVLDLGSGVGLDAFTAAQKMGPTGQPIGVDVTAEMLSKARGNAFTFTKRTGLDNVKF